MSEKLTVPESQTAKLIKFADIPDYQIAETARRKMPTRELSDADKIKNLRAQLLGGKKEDKDPREKFKELFSDS